MIAYPEGLPNPQYSGYDLNTVSPMRKTGLKGGRTIQRRGFRNTQTVVQVSWEMDDSQTQLFEGWFEYVLISGSLPFDCPLITPLGIQDYEAKFKGIYQGPVLTGISHWKFQAFLSLLRRPLPGSV